MKDIAAVRAQILAAFRRSHPPTAEQLIYSYKDRNAGSANRLRAELAGKHWEELSYAFLKERWSSFCYLTPQAYHYYLPALLVTALDHFHDHDIVHSVVYGLRPSEHAVYYHGADAQFEALLSELSSEEVASVASFMNLFLHPPRYDHMAFLTARAMRLGWGRRSSPESEAFQAFDREMRHFEYPIPEDPIKAALVREIREAFAETPYPGDNNLSGSKQGDEPAECALEFRGVNWKTVHPRLLASNYTSLSFLTAEGFRYFLPAYMIAELTDTGIESNADPIFHITHGFAQKSQNVASRLLEHIDTTAHMFEGMSREHVVAMLRAQEQKQKQTDWFAYCAERMSGFTRPERKAIIHYLTYVAEEDEYEAAKIHEAIERYWEPNFATG
jgi:hypothetical protein